MCYLEHSHMLHPLTLTTEKPNIMQARILYITPSGPLCFIDYLTVSDGMAVLEELKRSVSINKLTAMLYEFRLFRVMKDGLISIDRLILPRFDHKSIDIFLDSCYPMPAL